MNASIEIGQMNASIEIGQMNASIVIGRDEPNLRNRAERLPLTLATMVFGVTLVRNAWVCDDAYITFRTVDNFIRGYGLTWNVAERVQTYTHPLWMWLISPFYLVTREAYYTSIFLSIAVSLLAVLLLGKVARSPMAAVLGVAILTFSKAFVDYSTSGLENPLTHLLLSLFLLLYLKRYDGTPKMLFLLSLTAALGALSRMDNLILFFPPLIYAFWRRRDAKGVHAVLLGFLPFILWEGFSLFYYGFPFANTAYAKLNTGIGTTELMAQGWYYLLDSINRDPLTLLIIASALGLTVMTSKRRDVPIAVGIVLYLLYVVRIGGDFMSGRFLTASLLAAVALLSRYNVASFGSLRFLPFAVVLLVGLASPSPPLLSGADFVLNSSGGARIQNGIADERRVYYNDTGLLRVRRNTEFPDHRWANAGRQVRARGLTLVVRKTVGFFGYYVGPDVHVLDPLALGDPLLARLPAVSSPTWRIGHFERIVPDGYQASLESGENVIADEDLAAYYDQLSLITRGALFDPKRLVAIWNMNLGRYDHLIDWDAYRYPEMVYLMLTDVSERKAPGTQWNLAGNAVLSDAGAEIDLGGESHAPKIEISLDHNDEYQIVYIHRVTEIAKQTAETTTGRGLAVHLLDVPPGAVEEGYDRIRVLPLQGDGKYSLGHLLLLE